MFDDPRRSGATATAWAPCSHCARSLSSAEPRPWPPSPASPSISTPTCANESVWSPARRAPPHRNGSSPAGTGTRSTTPSAPGSPDTPPTRSANTTTRWSTLPSTARLRGSRTDGTAVHLLAAALHACQTVIARRQIAERSNAIPADGPLPRHWWTADSSSPRPRAARPRGRRTHPARRLLPWSVAEATGGSTSPSP